MKHRFTLYRRKLGGMFYIQDTRPASRRAWGQKLGNGYKVPQMAEFHRTILSQNPITTNRSYDFCDCQRRAIQEM